MQPFHANPVKTPAVLLTIAGHDPSSGAGITADLKVFAAHGFFGLSCPTLLTVQSTQGVVRSAPVAPELVRDMLQVLEEDFPLAGIKLGALGSTAVLTEVSGWLEARQRKTELRIPVVLDPVLRASSGAALLPPEALPQFRERLLPLCSVVTPNLAELAVLADASAVPQSADEVPPLAREVLALLAPEAALVVTGGHLPDRPGDFLLHRALPQGEWLDGKRVHTQSTHGTGCAFSSALACELAAGRGIAQAAAEAKAYVRRALETAYPLGKGHGPPNHLFRFYKEQ